MTKVLSTCREHGPICAELGPCFRDGWVVPAPVNNRSPSVNEDNELRQTVGVRKRV
jgi:hypothetical protein